MPIALKFLLNILLFFFYRLISCFLIWFFIWIMFLPFVEPGILTDWFYEKVAMGMVFVTLIVTILNRRFFYLKIKRELITTEIKEENDK